MLLELAAMRTTAGSTNPWGTSIDDGWKDLVVSSAPPPPPPARDEAPVKNRALPADLSTWQEHGAARAAAVVVDPANEPSFSAGDRRLWVVAGTLMAAAALVLGLLGFLTFGGNVTAPVPVAAAPVAVDPAPVEAAAPAHRAAPSRTPAAVLASKSSNPRILKATSHSKRARHQKRNIAVR